MENSEAVEVNNKGNHWFKKKLASYKIGDNSIMKCMYCSKVYFVKKSFEKHIFKCSKKKMEQLKNVLIIMKIRTKIVKNGGVPNTINVYI